MSAREEGQGSGIGGRLDGFEGLHRVSIASLPGGETAGAHDVEAAEDVGVLHADASGSVAAHGVADEAAGGAGWDGSIVGVDVGNDVAGDVVLKVAGGDGVGVHGPVVDGFGVGQDDDELVGALGEGSFDGLRNVDFATPLLGADGVAVQSVDDGIAFGLTGGVAGRKEDNGVPVDGIAFEVAFKGCTVDLDVFDLDGLGRGDDGRDLGGDLRCGHGER